MCNFACYIFTLMKRNIRAGQESAGRWPNIYFRLFIVVLVASMSVLLFSYVRARASKTEDSCNECGKCNGGKAKSEIILLESLTHTLVVSSR